MIVIVKLSSNTTTTTTFLRHLVTGIDEVGLVGAQVEIEAIEGKEIHGQCMKWLQMAWLNKHVLMRRTAK